MSAIKSSCDSSI